MLDRPNDDEYWLSAAQESEVADFARLLEHTPDTRPSVEQLEAWQTQIDALPPSSGVKILAQRLLSELRHERDRDPAHAGCRYAVARVDHIAARPHLVGPSVRGVELVEDKAKTIAAAAAFRRDAAKGEQWAAFAVYPVQGEW